MNYRPAKEIADEWGITVRRVQMMCVDGKIPGARKIGKLWMIPENPARPQDNRMAPGSERPIRKRSKETHEYNSEIDRRLMSVMSHDIRNSLNSIMGYSEMLRKNSKNPAKVEEIANKISDSGHSILLLVENASIFTKQNEEKAEMNEEICDISGLIMKTVSEAHNYAARQNISITRRVKLFHEFVYTDVEILNHIIANAIENAVKLAGTGGKVKVKVDELDSQFSGKAKIRYTIEDNGIGISEQYIEHIYEDFLDEKLHDGVMIEGIGFSIAVIQKLTEILNGTMKIESRPNSGTKLTLIFEHKIADLSEKIPDSDSDFSELKGKNILLAEDNEMNREIEAEILREVGMNVDCAEDGIICVAMLEKAKPRQYDCILMDLMMPNMDGISATRIIRSLDDEEKANIPIIAMTASVMKTDREKALTAGMNGFAEKPLNLGELFSMMSKML